MPASRWTDDLAINVKQVDTANESLFYLISHLFDEGVECRGEFCLGKFSCRKVDVLIAFLARNQAAEDVLMERHRYPDRHAHAREHARIINRLVEWRDLPLCHSAYRERVSLYMLDWAISHITSADQRLGRWMTAGDGAALPPEGATVVALLPNALARPKLPAAPGGGAAAGADGTETESLARQFSCGSAIGE